MLFTDPEYFTNPMDSGFKVILLSKALTVFSTASWVVPLALSLKPPGFLLPPSFWPLLLSAHTQAHKLIKYLVAPMASRPKPHSPQWVPSNPTDSHLSLPRLFYFPFYCHELIQDFLSPIHCWNLHPLLCHLVLLSPDIELRISKF